MYLDRVISKIRSLKEEAVAAPTVNVGSGNIAGTAEAGDNPPVRKKKRYIYQKNSRKLWSQFLKGRYMAFGLGKLAVLESKLDIYEDLSKEMLDKLERAVATISENSNRVAVVLERHESRLDKSDENDRAILKLIEKVEEKLDGVETRVNDLSRFRWISVGIAIAAVTILEAPSIFGNFLTPDQQPARVERTK